jgi:hypothetical protein
MPKVVLHISRLNVHWNVMSSVLHEEKDIPIRWGWNVACTTTEKKGTGRTDRLQEARALCRQQASLNPAHHSFPATATCCFQSASTSEIHGDDDDDACNPSAISSPRDGAMYSSLTSGSTGWWSYQENFLVSLQLQFPGFLQTFKAPVHTWIAQISIAFMGLQR